MAGGGAFQGGFEERPDGVLLRVSGTYDTGADDLWEAVTEPARLERWLGTITGDLRPGGSIRALLADTGEDVRAVIERCDPSERLVLRWVVSGDPAESVVELALTEDPGGTRLTITEHPVPSEQAAGYGAGWQTRAERLAAFASGDALPDWEARWRELLPAYAEARSGA